MYQSDFFASNKKPIIHFDKTTFTWTLANEAVRRDIRFDPGSGGLQTLFFGEVRKQDDPLVRVVSEGQVSLSAPLESLPSGLSKGWKVSETAPAGEWTTVDYDDSSWKSTDLPFTTELENRSWWFRYHIPAGTLQSHLNYVLLLDQAVDDGADIYVDGVQVGVLTLADQPWTKVFQFPLPATARVVSIRLEGGGRPNSLGNIRIAEVNQSRTLDLSHDWEYVSHDVKDNTLTIRLKGVGNHDGFEVDVRYRVFPGNEPYQDKSITVTNHGKDRWLVEEVLLDRYAVNAESATEQTFTGSGRAISESGNKRGLVCGVMDLQGLTRSSSGGKVAEAAYRPFIPLNPGETVAAPKAVSGFYTGPTATGAFLLQLYVGSYITTATPTTIPPLYNTWFGYYGEINEELIRQLVPRAADLGIKTFVIDDGWQMIEDGNGGYGDWVVNKAKFPNGIEPISELVRQHGLRFGMWSAPIMVQNTSRVALEHPEWLVKRWDGSRRALWGDSSAMCITGDYYQHYRKQFLDIVKRYKLGFVKMDGVLFVDGCVAEGHDHPLSHSDGAQVKAWEDLVENLRREVPGIIVSRGWEGEPGVTALQDSGWFGDWAVAFHPEREADPRWWYRNADIYRHALYELSFTRPAFALSWEAPCHILSKPLDLNALEYHFTSIGAWICNVEIHGRLLESTPEEIALVKKWIQWNWDNREWLAYAQPITSLGRPYDPQSEKSEPRIDGVLHLRNVLKGRYGYVALWNPAETSGVAEISVRPQDYFVKMDTKNVELVSVRDARKVDMERGTDSFSFKVPMKPLSWEILEIREVQ